MALDFLQNPDNFDCQKCQKVKYKSKCDIHPMKCEERARERENYYVIIHFLQNSNDDILPWHLWGFLIYTVSVQLLTIYVTGCHKNSVHGYSVPQGIRLFILSSFGIQGISKFELVAPCFGHLTWSNSTPGLISNTKKSTLESPWGLNLLFFRFFRVHIAISVTIDKTNNIPSRHAYFFPRYCPFKSVPHLSWDN